MGNEGFGRGVKVRRRAKIYVEDGEERRRGTPRRRMQKMRAKEKAEENTESLRAMENRKESRKRTKRRIQKNER
eukprot:CAMPEP_0197322754 /NCGR_PEP_ID=MMETSP0891-20130614/70089_1 /TAXON_ID=44058 ORGANISM="Aureoumbra lagunensis, Strain CCMP1510" /NCGR_SAMPLE_ID=MMETSP0891 /ASSEMBLY_ACC=CAM_ASM_000534 /LENGTH=73 /DNA_ID=CAMNT_0042815225 /DNA_START=1742 /DNA_END=1963 /DNA_ORIENTATION=+